MILRSDPSQNLDLGRRAALRIRVTTALELRNRGLPGRDKLASAQLRSLLRSVLAASDVLLSRPELAGQSQGDLAAQIEAALAPFWGWFDANPPVPVVGKRVAPLKSALASENVSCAHCAGDQTAPMSCRREFDTLFASIDDAVGGAYALLMAEAGISPPNLILILKPIEANQRTGLLDTTAILGSCKFDDDTVATSRVTLSIRDESFDWVSLCQVPYTLFHELLCHAYQGLAGCDREEVQSNCAWTEGWMDTLAAEFTQDWLAADERLPNWIRTGGDNVKSETQGLHERRMAAQDGLSIAVLDQRQNARETCRYLRRLYQGASAKSGPANARLWDFSLRLNLDAVPADERRRLMDYLGLGFEFLFDSELDKLVGACTRYAQQGGWERLRDDVRALVIELMSSGDAPSLPPRSSPQEPISLTPSNAPDPI